MYNYSNKDFYSFKPYVLLVLSIAGLVVGTKISILSSLILAACAGHILYTRHQFRQEAQLRNFADSSHLVIKAK